MKLTLSPSFELTTEHSASCHGIPVLVNRVKNEVYGPGDIFQPYPSWGFVTAKAAVSRLTRNGKFTDAEKDFIRMF
jgi:hypothetical protein